jgi:hypothetical protein
LLFLFFFFFFFFFLKIVFNISSLSTWLQVCVSNRNFTDGFLLKFYLFIFSQPLHNTHNRLFRLLCMTGHRCRNLIPIRYECLL